jgi:hypothetical protein
MWLDEAIALVVDRTRSGRARQTQGGAHDRVDLA